MTQLGRSRGELAASPAKRARKALILTCRAVLSSHGPFQPLGGVMRGLALFVAGLLVGGIAVHTALAQSSLSPNKGIVMVNHVGMNVPDLDKAVEYYTKTLGFPEAFRSKNAKGEVQLVYVQVSQNTFVECQPDQGDSVQRHRSVGQSHGACRAAAGIAALSGHEALEVISLAIR